MKEESSSAGEHYGTISTSVCCRELYSVQAKGDKNMVIKEIKEQELSDDYWKRMENIIEARSVLAEVDQLHYFKTFEFLFL